MHMHEKIKTETKLESFKRNPNWGALETHLREAMHINTLRMPLYGKLSGGRTISHSKRFIRYEKLAILFAKPIDWYAKRYQKAGVPIVNEDYITMEKTPEFKESLEAPFPRLDQLIKP